MSIRPILEGVAGDGGELVGDAYRVANGADLASIPGYVGGIITVPDGEILTIDQVGSPIISDVNFVPEGTAEVRIRSSLAKATWQHTREGGTFVSGEGIRFSMFNIELESTATTSKFIDTFNCTLQLDGTAIAGFSDLGQMEGTGITALDVSGATSFIDRFDTGLSLINMIISVDGMVVTSQTLVGDAIIVENDIPLPIVSSFNNVKTLMSSSNNVFDINPISTDNFKLIVSNVLTAGGEGLFDTAGTDGTFTAVADGSVSISIDSVQDDGSGLAQFNYTAGPDAVYVGEVVTISGYTTNTAYNGTYIVTAVPGAGTSFVVNVNFGTNEGGGQVDANVLTLTDTATPLTDGETITISTDNSLLYDGGATVFNQQTNTFEINGSFSVTASGTWSTRGLDQMSPAVSARGNPGFQDSAITAEVAFNGNALITSIPAAGANVFVNASSWTVTGAERLKTDSDGGVIYFGLESTPTINDGNIYLEPSSSTKNLSCQFVNIDAVRVSCTFNTVNDAITTSSAHGLSVNDTITLRGTDGVIDGALRDDIVYYVESVVSATEYTVSYTQGGALIALTGGSSGDTTYAAAVLKGSRPQEPIAANNPRTLVPQAIEFLSTGDTPSLVISNEDDTVDVLVANHYYRVK